MNWCMYKSKLLIVWTLAIKDFSTRSADSLRVHDQEYVYEMSIKLQISLLLQIDKGKER